MSTHTFQLRCVAVRSITAGSIGGNSSHWSLLSASAFCDGASRGAGAGVSDFEKNCFSSRSGQDGLYWNVSTKLQCVPQSGQTIVGSALTTQCQQSPCPSGQRYTLSSSGVRYDVVRASSTDIDYSAWDANLDIILFASPTPSLAESVGR